MSNNCHICSNGSGSYTCLACVVGVTGPYGSDRFIRLMEKGIIDGSKVVTLAGETNTARMVTTVRRQNRINKVREVRL